MADANIPRSIKEAVKVAVVTMTTTADKQRNIDTAFSMVRTAAAQGAAWVQLPEMFPYMGTYDQVYNMAEVEGGPLYQALSNLARDLKIVLFAGSVGEAVDWATTSLRSNPSVRINNCV